MTRPVDHTMRRLFDEARARPILVDVWSPAPDDTASAQAPQPTILLSHGAYGAANNYSWTAEHLAAAGFVVMGISHFGESFMYGPDTIDPATAAQPWLRPPDCSVALDQLLVDPVIGPTVDVRRIGALGHSSGGGTVISLAGAVYDPVAMADYCGADAEARDRGCDYARHAPPLRTAPDAARQSYRDDRVRAVVALDPALGPGFRTDALANVAIPVLIVGATDNDFLPFEAHAGHIAAGIPGSTLVSLSAGEGHFVYLDASELDLTANGVPLYRDRPGVDRAAVHARLAPIITGFFEEQLA